MKHLVLLTALFVVCTCTLTAQEKQQATGLTIAEAKLGRDVQNHEIVNEDSTFAPNDKVYLWMKIVGGKSDSVTVTWKNGQYSSSTTLRVGGSPWRTWAYKTASIGGDWTVTVTDASGAVLKEMNFSVSAPVAK